MGRKVLVSVDESAHSQAMLGLALQYAIHKSTDQIHLITVLHPPSSSMYSVAPVVAGAAITAAQHGQEHQRHAEERQALDMLRQVAEMMVTTHRVPRTNIHEHVLPAAGGASGVSDSILGFAKANHVDMLLVGSRGMGALRSTLMSLVGLGSVGDAMLHGAPCPVLLFKCDPSKLPRAGAEAEPPPAAPATKRVLVAYDDSLTSRVALQWAIEQLLGPHDQLHIVSVAMPASLPMLDEASAVAGMQLAMASAEQDAAAAEAARCAESAAEAAVAHGVTRTKISTKVLMPQGGPSDAGSAISDYASEKGIHVVVVGSRGLGAVQRQLMGLVGLGSVSEYLAHHLHCAVAVVRPDAVAEGTGAAMNRGSPAMSRGSMGDLSFQVIPEDEEAAE